MMYQSKKGKKNKDSKYQRNKKKSLTNILKNTKEKTSLIHKLINHLHLHHILQLAHFFNKHLI